MSDLASKTSEQFDQITQHVVNLEIKRAELSDLYAKLYKIVGLELSSRVRRAIDADDREQAKLWASRHVSLSKHVPELRLLFAKPASRATLRRLESYLKEGELNDRESSSV